MVLVAASSVNVNAPYPSHHRSCSLGSCHRKTWARVHRAFFTLADSIPPPRKVPVQKTVGLVTTQGGQGIYHRRHYTAPCDRTLLSPRRGDGAVIFFAVVARAAARNHSVLMASEPPRDRLHRWVSRQTRASLTKETQNIVRGTSTREARPVLARGGVHPLFIPVQMAFCNPQGQALRPHPLVA